MKFHHSMEKGHVSNITFKCLQTGLRNLFDFYAESISFKIKILIYLIINNSCLFNIKLNIVTTVNIAIFLKTATSIEHLWCLLLNSNLIVAMQILTKTKRSYFYNLILATQTKQIIFFCILFTSTKI